MAKISWKPGNMIYPLPAVMVTVGDGKGNDNIITVAWTGTVCTNPPMAYISVRPERYSYNLIKETKEFVINLTTKDLCFATDYCGVKSGRDIDKFKECNLTPIKVEGLKHAVGIEQSPLILGCKVKRIIELGSHDMFLAETVSVMAQDKLFDNKDKLCLDRAGLIGYIHGEYFETGRKLGFFGWSVASKKVLKRRKTRSR